MSRAKECADCRDGEHDNIDDRLALVVVRDPDSNRLVKRSWMCGEHRSVYLDDGYDVNIIRKARGEE
jgi:hypothetical protein